MISITDFINGLTDFRNGGPIVHLFIEEDVHFNLMCNYILILSPYIEMCVISVRTKSDKVVVGAKDDDQRTRTQIQ